MGFDHERLDVYQLALKFISWTSDLFIELDKTDVRRIREVCDHLDRAGLSILFNTAEGNGRRHPKVRAKFFDDARGSGMECSACLDALVAKGVCTKERIAQGKEMLVRIVSMLCKLVQRFAGPDALREHGLVYEAGSHNLEHEYEHDHDITTNA